MYSDSLSPALATNVPVQLPVYEQLLRKVGEVRFSVKTYENFLETDIIDTIGKCLDNILEVSFGMLLKPRGIVYADQCIYHLNFILQYVNNTANPQHKEFIQAHVEALKQARPLK